MSFMVEYPCWLPSQFQPTYFLQPHTNRKTRRLPAYQCMNCTDQPGPIKQRGPQGDRSFILLDGIGLLSHLVCDTWTVLLLQKHTSPTSPAPDCPVFDVPSALRFFLPVRACPAKKWSVPPPRTATSAPIRTPSRMPFKRENPCNCSMARLHARHGNSRGWIGAAGPQAQQRADKREWVTVPRQPQT